MRDCSLFILLAMSICSFGRAAEITATLGQQDVLIPDGKYDLHDFPQAAITIISIKPVRFLMVAANRTFLMEGESFETAKPTKAVLEPSNTPGAYDESYAGISGIYINHEEKK